MITLALELKPPVSWSKPLESRPEEKNDSWFNRGVVLANLGQFEEAIVCFDKALKIKQDDHKAWYNRGIALANLGRFKEGISSWDKALEIKPELYQAWCNKGVVLHKLGHLQEAVNSYDKALGFKSDDPKTWENRGIVLGDLGHFEEAIASLSQGLKIKDNQGDYDQGSAWYNLGVLFLQLKRHKEAITSFDQSLAFKADDYEAWDNRGRALGNLGCHKEAITSFDKAVELKPDFYSAWYNRGVALYKLGRLEEVIASNKKALEIKPDSYQAWSGLGVTLANLGRYEEAIASYDKALKITPEYAEAFYDKTRCYTLLGNVEQAIYNLQKAISLSPDKFIEMAKTDSAFDLLREDKRFQALIAGEIRILRHNVSWEEFENIIAEMGDDRASRVAYDQGTLEIFMPSKPHEYYKEIFGDLIKYLADELEIDYIPLGSTLWKREKLLKGAEPDNCFYIKNEALIRDKILDIDLSKDPPPDLILEVDYTSPSLDKLPIYAGLGVPEIWLYDMKEFYIYELQDGEYKETEASLAFPNFPVKGIPDFIEQNISASRTVLRKKFRNWVNSVSV